jgi:hypothetical protein
VFLRERGPIGRDGRRDHRIPTVGKRPQETLRTNCKPRGHAEATASRVPTAAARQFLAAYVAFGSKADIGLALVDVRFTPKSGHGSAELGQGKMVPVPPPCCRRTNTRSTSMVGREHREDHCPAIIPVGISGLDRGMSALPPKADMAQHRCDVRFVPKADISVVPRTQ